MLSARMETGSHKLLELSLSTSSRSLSIPGTHAVCLARGSFLLGLFQCLLLGKNDMHPLSMFKGSLDKPTAYE